MQRAVDSNHVALCQHLLQIHDTPASNLLLDLRLQWLVVEVQQLLAVEGLQPSQDSLSNAPNRDGADDFAFEVVFVLGGGGDVPLALDNLLVGGHKVAHQHKDRHDDVFRDGDDVGPRHFCNRYASVGLVRGVEVDMVGANAGGYGELELLGLGEALCGEVARVEAVAEGYLLAMCWGGAEEGGQHARGGDDDLGVYKLLVELGVLAFLVRCRYEGVALVLEPLADAQLVLGRACAPCASELVIAQGSLAGSYPAALGRLWHAGGLHTKD